MGNGCLGGGVVAREAVADDVVALLHLHAPVASAFFTQQWTYLPLISAR
jgi:hypothetical protein